MANQEQSRDGIPRKNPNRPSPDVGSPASAQGTGDAPERHEPGQHRPRAGDSGQDHEGDGPAKIGVTSDRQPDLVAPSGVNERDHGAADDRPAAGGTLDFDDGTDMVHPRGKVTSTGRAWNDKNPSDAGRLGAPGAGLSERNGPSDPDAKRDR
jgi:hypothetical protein